MPEIRTRKNARRIGQNTDAGKRMLDSFLRSKQSEVGSENSETEYAAERFDFFAQIGADGDQFIGTDMGAGKVEDLFRSAALHPEFL